VDDDLDRFREQARRFLERHAIADAGSPEDDPRGDLALDRALHFQRALYGAGLAGLSVPVAFGGRGLPVAYEQAWREEAGRFPLMTESLAITLGNCLSTLLEFGSDTQRRRHVPSILAGDAVWCQLFSEPGAGSDLGAVQTRGAPVPGGWLLNGQKVWTTLAHRADFGILLARTDPTAPKRDGLSMLIVDLAGPGVETRPIRQIDGAMHFDEVFLTDVFVPSDFVLGPVGEGWRIASAMLHHQRVARAAGQRAGVRHDRTDLLLAELRRGERPVDPAVRDALVRLYIAEVCQSLLVARSVGTAAPGTDPGPIGSVGKLANALVARRFGELAWRVAGADSTAWDGPALGEPGPTAAGARWAADALYTLSLSIAGGTNEIQRTIIAERLLELPREPVASRRLDEHAFAARTSGDGRRDGGSWQAAGAAPRARGDAAQPGDVARLAG
jgi:alkylation response protein AidB-like acyl-CoA dehydrogenase